MSGSRSLSHHKELRLGPSRQQQCFDFKYETATPNGQMHSYSSANSHTSTPPITISEMTN
eukprot:CAMPEP_0174374756 /NCGR_PEP_ID=MMETSP0811_2-20130205/112114_1 /TAXON_ID=73025 ORGANISM="Eutreptiella gymnastica-like, Strain CCMP1594" /NCGR_SAMPLE_ID=MMETSP0811_2 /ASSEMBLY_ACC=CAM_ASM_000667 /LENGTH=59 /DNA_ID=CAMNT_0015524357 /DNA_START=19 /DNA_END=198 /DNA_ORIENTATION=+